jgi:hypothetical protein
MYSTIPIHWNIKSAPACPGRSRVGPAFYVFSFLGSTKKIIKRERKRSTTLARWVPKELVDGIPGARVGGKRVGGNRFGGNRYLDIGICAIGPIYKSQLIYLEKRTFKASLSSR